MSIKGEKGERMCVVCRTHATPDNLIRLVRIDGAVMIDPTGKANGRGAYICKSQNCAELCKKRNSLNRAFKMTVDSNVYDQLLEFVKVK